MTLKTVAFALFLDAALFNATALSAEFIGVDEAVVGRFAANAGRPPTPPLLNPDNGDLGLLLFLTAGAIGGFVCGYCFRSLYPKERSEGTRRDV